MKNCTDIIFGILSWTVALLVAHQSTIGMHELMPFEFTLALGPALWIILLFVTFHFAKRPIRKLWWVWFSIPFGITPWLFIAIIIIVEKSYD